MILRKPRAGFVGFGEVNTPRDIIERKCHAAEKFLASNGIEVSATAPVSDDPAGNEPTRAVKELSGKEFDYLVVCIAGWIPSHAVIRIVSEFAHRPILLWSLSGWMENGRLLTTADQAGAAALRKPMEDMGFRFKYVYDTVDSGTDAQAIIDFARAARAARMLKHAKVGMMGCRDMKLYGTMYDAVSLCARIGVEVEHFEMFEIAQRIETMAKNDTAAVISDIRKRWKFEMPADDVTLEKGVRYYLALRQKIMDCGYEAVSLIDVDGMKKLAGFPPAMIFMLLADREKICTIPENDTLGSVTQLMTKYLTGQAGAYLEFYEFMKDRVLLGVPDYVPEEIIDGPVRVRPASFGGFSGGLLNVSKIKTGRVTLARLACTGNRYQMHVVTGEAVSPRFWEEAGWTPPAPRLPGLEIILDVPVKEFAQKVMSQHYIISYGDNTGAFRDLSAILGIEMIKSSSPKY